MRVIRGDEVLSLLAGRETEVTAQVERAYRMHTRQETSNPHSVFLRFAGRPEDRIIALPAYIGDDVQVAGLKWIASVPSNVRRGRERASAVLILNDARTGQAHAILEASAISAARTAASAALAARVLVDPSRPPRSLGLVGCGRINLEVALYVSAVFPQIEAFDAFDIDGARARGLGERLSAAFPHCAWRFHDRLDALLEASALVSFATTAAVPHVRGLAACAPGTTILHLSLRDLDVDCILATDNVVDDMDHVCRASTSVHLTEERVGNRSFVRCTLGEILERRAAARPDPDRITVFSPFGLGILDLAVGQLVLGSAIDQGLGTVVRSFSPRAMVW